MKKRREKINIQYGTVLDYQYYYTKIIILFYIYMYNYYTIHSLLNYTVNRVKPKNIMVVRDGTIYYNLNRKLLYFYFYRTISRCEKMLNTF